MPWFWIMWGSGLLGLFLFAWSGSGVKPQPPGQWCERVRSELKHSRVTALRRTDGTLLPVTGYWDGESVVIDLDGVDSWAEYDGVVFTHTTGETSSVGMNRITVCGPTILTVAINIEKVDWA